MKYLIESDPQVPDFFSLYTESGFPLLLSVPIEAITALIDRANILGASDTAVIVAQDQIETMLGLLDPINEIVEECNLLWPDNLQLTPDSYNGRNLQLISISDIKPLHVISQDCNLTRARCKIDLFVDIDFFLDSHF